MIRGLIDGLAAWVDSLGPLRIDDIEVTDPTLVLTGETWSMALTCPWKLLVAGVEVVDWEDSGAEDAAWDLVGRSIMGVHPRSSEHPDDPVFVLTGKYSLAVAADSDLDPWVMSFPGRTFVGRSSPGGDDVVPTPDELGGANA